MAEATPTPATPQPAPKAKAKPKQKAIKPIKIQESKLNLKQEAFCQLFVSAGEFFGNGTQAYIEAYDIDITKKGAYDGARASAYNLLTNTHICDRINSLLESGGLNDENVDKQLLLIINQHGDFRSKVRAIQEYNKLKSRVTEKHQHTIVSWGDLLEVIHGRKEVPNNGKPAKE